MDAAWLHACSMAALLNLMNIYYTSMFHEPQGQSLAPVLREGAKSIQDFSDSGLPDKCQPDEVDGSFKAVIPDWLNRICGI